MRERTLRILLALTAASALSCGEPVGETETAVVTTINFAARNGEMLDGVEVSPGLDLDGTVSGRGDADSCRRADFVAPDGTPGIDNQFTYLFETVEDMAEEGTVEGIIQGSITNGRLLLMIELEGVQDWRNDDDVTVSVYNAVGAPALGSDGMIVPDQTFDRDPDSPVNVGKGRITDGVLETDPFFVELPMAFFNVFFDLQLEGAIIRANVSEKGVTDGVLGGAVAIDAILGIAAMADAMQGEQYSPLLRSILPSLADMQREGGACQALSANLGFESRRAFIFEGDPPPSEEPADDPAATEGE